MSNKPIHTIREGACKVTIWRNDRPDGKGYWYSLNPGRTYTDTNDQPQTASDFSGGDILQIAELMRLGYHWIRQQKAKDASDARQAQEAA